MNIDIIPVTTFQQNCSLVWDDDKNAAIIDPGGEAEKLIRRVKELELNLNVILLTHGHLDHVGAAMRLRTQFGVDILGPNSEDKFWFDMLPQQSRQFSLFEVSAFKPDRWLDKEGEIISVGDLSFKVLHLPGHTPGHIGFIEINKNIAFTGDVLFQGGIGRTDFPRGDQNVLLQSIREKLYSLDDNMIIIPGHGPYTTIGQEKAHNPYTMLH